MDTYLYHETGGMQVMSEACCICFPGTLLTQTFQFTSSLSLASICCLTDDSHAEFELGTPRSKVLMMFVIIFAFIAMIAGAGPTGSTHHAENYSQLPAFPNEFKVGSTTSFFVPWQR